MPGKKPPEGYMTVPEAAKVLHVASQTMYQWVVIGKIPCKTHLSGTRTFYFLKKEDVDLLAEKYEPVKKARLYEIIMITCGKLDVLFATESLHELSNKYVHMAEKGHKLVRLRVDGRVLTIHESDKVRYAYHPRTKRGRAV